MDGVFLKLGLLDGINDVIWFIFHINIFKKLISNTKF